jgi:hypothetical protein
LLLTHPGEDRHRNKITKVVVEVKGDPSTTITIICYDEPTKEAKKDKKKAMGHIQIIHVGDFDVKPEEQTKAIEALKQAKLVKS